MNKLAHKSPRWREVYLADVVDQESPICYGIVLPGDHVDGGVPVIKVKDIEQGSVRTSGLLQTSPDIDARYKRSRLTGGDILLSIRGTVGRLGVVPDELTGANITQDTARIRISCPETCAYVYQALQSGDLQTQIRDHIVGQAVKGINIRDVKRLKLLLPTDRQAQKYIAELLRTQDTAIQKTERLIAAKERHYGHELSRLISRGQHPHGHIGTFAEEVSARNRGGNEARVLSVTNSRGFVLPEEQFERRVASADLSNYKVVRRGQYAYNPSRINVGSIARLDGWDDGVLSPMYVVFLLDEAKVDSDYFLHWLNSHEARQRIKNSAQGSVRETVSFSEFAAITIPLPDTNTQTAIARYLSALREEVDLLAQSVAAVKTQKRGLMQKLLTGQWRLPIPEDLMA
jgi:type I restriction enzyme S subunit